MSSNPSMSTPINSIPLKTSKNMNDIEDDSSDPLVQDVLNEFQREISSNTKHFQPPPPQEQQIPIFHPPPQQAPIMHPPPSMIHHQPPPLMVNKNNLINIEIAKKAAIITAVSLILFYPGLFTKICQNILPLNIQTILANYEFYIMISIVFIIVYFLYYSKQL